MQRILLWLLLVCGLSGLAVMQWREGVQIETDLLALLPETELDAIAHEARERMARRNQGDMAILIGHPQSDIAREAATAWCKVLAELLPVLELHCQVPAQTKSLAAEQLLLRHRDAFITSDDRELLPAQLKRRALNQLYSPVVAPVQQFSLNDPLYLLTNYRAALVPDQGKFRLHHGWLSVEADGNTYYLVHTAAAGNSLSLTPQQRLADALRQADRAAQAIAPTIRISKSGFVFHALDSAKQAKREISLIGGVSLLTIVVLMWLTFGSFRPLLLGLFTLVCGLGAGLVVTVALFGKIHLLTGVFGAVLIGVAIDYVMHWQADRFRQDGSWNGQQALIAVGPALTMGLITSCLGYLALTLAPIPGLQQMACFSIAGLIMAWATVMSVYPSLTESLPQDSRRQHRWLMRPIAWRLNVAKSNRLKLVLLLIAALAGVVQLTSGDNLRLLYQASTERLVADKLLQQVSGQQPVHQFLLLTGHSSEALLQREEVIRRDLKQLSSDVLGGYEAVSQLLPSQDQQLANKRYAREHVYGPAGPAASLLTEIGADPSQIEMALNPFDESNTVLTLDDWPQLAAGRSREELWLGKIGSQYGSILALRAPIDGEALIEFAASHADLRYIDPASQMSVVLKAYRERALRLLAVAFGLVLLLTAVRYGWRSGLCVVATPALAVVSSLGLLGWLGMSLNLFATLALFLVLGIGIDYAIFLHEGREQPRAPLLAITLSALTTVLSFGLLAFSATPFLAIFGLVVLTGIFTAWLVAPWLIPCPHKH